MLIRAGGCAESPSESREPYTCEQPARRPAIVKKMTPAPAEQKHKPRGRVLRLQASKNFPDATTSVSFVRVNVRPAFSMYRLRVTGRAGQCPAPTKQPLLESVPDKRAFDRLGRKRFDGVPPIRNDNCMIPSCQTGCLSLQRKGISPVRCRGGTGGQGRDLTSTRPPPQTQGTVLRAVCQPKEPSPVHLCKADGFILQTLF